MGKLLAARVPKPLEEVVREVASIEGVDRSTALRKLLEMGAERWRRERALGLLRKGEVTLWKAAEIAGMNLWDMIDLVRGEETDWVKLSPEEIEREFEDSRKVLKRKIR